MRIDVESPRTPRRGRSSATTRLRDALGDLAQGRAEIVRHQERNWASITFAGTRHTLEIAFQGSEAIMAGEHLIDALPDHEFTLPGQIVADATVTGVAHTLLPEPCMQVTVELLLLEDA